MAQITLVMTSLPLARVFQCLFTFALVSASRWLAEIWQLSRRGATGELMMEFKFQGRSYKRSSFSRPAARAPRRACLQAIRGCNGQEWIDCYGDSMAEWLARRTPVVPGSSPAPITSWIYYLFFPIANPPSSLYSQLLPCGNPSITDTPIKRTAAKSQQKYIRDIWLE